MDLTWILYTYAGSSITYRVVVSEIVRSIRSLDECDKILKKWFNDNRKSVGFYPVSDEEFEKLPDNQVFLHV
jgi:hypothetical protein